MNNKTPKLRFKTFNNEYLMSYKLSEVCNITMGQSPDSASYNENGIGLPLIQGNADIENRHVVPRKWTSDPKKISKEGDLIITVRAPAGYISKSNLNACLGRGVCSLSPGNLINSEYTFQLLINSESKWSKVEQGATFSAISAADIQNFEVNIPSLNEQEKIASFLSSVDKKITQLQKKHDLLVEYKKQTSKNIFDKNRENKSIKLSEICQVMRSGGTPKSTNAEYYGGDIPFLSISDMTHQGKYLNYTEKTITKSGLENSSSWIVPEKSLIYSMYASVGIPAINNIPIATSQAVINLLFKENVDLEFMYYYLDEYKREISKYIAKGTQGNINSQIVRNINVHLPPTNEQFKISKTLGSIDKKIDQINKAIALNKEFKKGLLQQMFV